MTLPGRLHRALGTPGLMMAGISVVSFLFGLVVLVGEYNWLRDTGRDTLRRVVTGWVRTLPVDYLGRTLADYADQWQRATPSDRPARLERLKRALNSLGTQLDRHGEQYPLLSVFALELEPRNRASVATWRSESRRLSSATLLDRVPVLPASGGPEIDLKVWCAPTPELQSAALELETSYHRLLLALLGLSGYSLLCLGYMVLHARSVRERVARESARDATLDLADRTCHELGNVVFVLANEGRNLAEHLALVERFADEGPKAVEAAARRSGIDRAQAERFEEALRAEYASRGVAPDVELLSSAAIARDVCRQIAVCSDYIALTVRELDGYLKQSALPVMLGPVAVDQCLDDSLALLGPRLEAACAEVERRGATGVQARAIADRRLLVHALVNLLKNAVEAASATGRTPRITLTIENDGPSLMVGIADNGPGILDSDRHRLFELGYSTKGPGRGRGLAIVCESVRAQGGEIDVHSLPGAGAQFQIRLPTAPPPETVASNGQADSRR
jgi:signal transduction histidine kinase